MHTGAIDILMYHSIAEGTGPTCIAPAIFREHMAALAESGYHTITLATCAAWMRGEVALAERPVVLTFDDGFDDFARVAFPELQARGWTATVFLPTGKVGGTDDWDAHPPGAPARARRTSDAYNLPRIEMWYFRNLRRWRAYLEGGARGYVVLRQTLRTVRTLATVGSQAVTPWR